MATTTPVTSYRAGYLEASAYQDRSPTELLNGHFDAIVLASSWDARSVCITQAQELRATRAFVFYFDRKDTMGLRDSHDRLLDGFCRERCDDVVPISGPSEKVSSLWPALLNGLRQQSEAQGRPLRLLVDLSACPRYLSLGATVACLRSGLASSIVHFYAEAEYPDESKATEEHEIFTGEQWDAVPVPSAEGRWDPTKKRAYVASVGFEGSKTLRLISRAEPEIVSVLFPDPGVRPEYAERTRRSNAALFERFRIDDATTLRAAAGNAVAAWRALDGAAVMQDEKWNTYLVCCGTKPHSLALALTACVRDSATLLYIVPDRHKVVSIAPSGVYWRFDVKDLSSITGQSVGGDDGSREPGATKQSI